MKLSGLVFLSVVVSFPAFAYKRVSFEFGEHASPVVVALLADAENLPEVDNPAWDSGIPITQAKCTATVLRPERIPLEKGGTEPSITDEGNRINCTYRQEGEGDEDRTISLSLAKVPIDNFGNFFQHKRSFSIKGDLAQRLKSTMARAYSFTEHSPLLTLADDSFSTGDRHVTYAVRLAPAKPGPFGTLEEQSPLLECMTFAYLGKVTTELCAFIYFGKD